MIRKYFVIFALITFGILLSNSAHAAIITSELVPNAVAHPATNGTRADTGGFGFTAQSLMTAAQITNLNTSNARTYMPASASASVDTFVYVNFTLPSYEKITGVFVTTIMNTSAAGHMKGTALFNYTSNLWLRVNTSFGAIGTLNTTLHNLTLSTNYSTDFISGNNLALMAYQNSTANGNIGIDFMSVNFTYEPSQNPWINLTAPVNGTTITSATISFNATFTDNFALRNATLFIWNSSFDLINQTNRSIIGLTDGVNITVTLPYTGTFYWNYFAVDNSSNAAMNSSNFTLTYADTIAPVVTINHPANDTIDPPILFNVTLNENGLCNFTLNNGLFNYTMQNNGNRDFNATNASIADGQYIVRYYCLDTSGNLNSTTNRTFVVFDSFTAVTINVSNALSLITSNADKGNMFKTSTLGLLFSERVSKFSGILKLNSQSIGINGSASRTGRLFRLNNLQLTINSAISRFANLFKRNSQTVTVGSSTSKLRAVFSTQNQRLTIDNAISRLARMFRIQGQVVSVNAEGADAGGILRYFVEFAEQINIRNNIQKLANLFKSPSQALNLNSIGNRIFGVLKLPSQMMQFNIGVGDRYGTRRSPTQGFVISAATGRIGNVFRISTNILSLNNAIRKNYGVSRATAQSVSVGNSVKRMGKIFRISTQQVFIENAVRRVGGLSRYLIEIAQNLTLGNRGNRNSHLFKGFSDLMRFLFGTTGEMTEGQAVGGGSSGGTTGSGGSSEDGYSLLVPETSLGKLNKAFTLEILLEKPITFYLGKGQVHSITLVELNSENATFVVESTPQIETLSSGDERIFDFNKDDLDDLRMGLVSIDIINNKSIIKISPLNGADKLTSLIIDPQRIQVSLRQGETTNREIYIKNTGLKDVKLKFEAEGINEYVKMSESEIEIKAGQSKVLNVDFLIREDTRPDLYIGKIVASGSGFEEEILIAIDASSKSALFDIKLDIFKGKIISSGDSILANIQMLNFGKEGRVDVNLYYTIRNFQTGRIYELGDETLAIDTQINFVREFKTPSTLKSGIYLLTVRAVYPGEFNSETGVTRETVVTGGVINEIDRNNIVTSSAWFTVINSYSLFVYIILIIVVIVTIVVSITHLKKKRLFAHRHHALNLGSFRRMFRDATSWIGRFSRKFVQVVKESFRPSHKHAGSGHKRISLSRREPNVVVTPRSTETVERSVPVSNVRITPRTPVTRQRGLYKPIFTPDNKEIAPPAEQPFTFVQPSSDNKESEPASQASQESSRGMKEVTHENTQENSRNMQEVTHEQESSKNMKEAINERNEETSRNMQEVTHDTEEKKDEGNQESKDEKDKKKKKSIDEDEEDYGPANWK